jgi:sulfide:quinone oxidoreductase
MWVMKKDVLPWVYWNRMLRGGQHERRFIPGGGQVRQPSS